MTSQAVGASTIATKDGRSFGIDKRYLAPILVTIVLVVGQVTFGFLESWSRTFLAIATAIGGYAIVANDNWLARVIVVAGGLMVGAIVGGALYLSGIANPITRKVCGVKDTRLLT